MLVARRRGSPRSFGGAAAALDNCSLSSLRQVTIGQNSFVYDGRGKLMASIPSERNRQPVALATGRPWLRKATIAIEDRRFYQHGGVDWEGILRAAVRDIEAGKAVEGASTITQQLVRNLYPISTERTLERKIKEACLAIKLSRKWSKDKILRHVPERRLLRQPRLRREGGRAHVLQHVGLASSTSARRRCSPAFPRRRRSTTRSSGRTWRSRAGTRFCARCSKTAT